MTENHTDDELLKALGRHAREHQSRDALRPLPGDFQKRMAEQIKRSVTDPEASDEDSPPAKTATHPVPWLALAASVLAAVGLTFLLVPKGPAVGLPGYSLEFRGGAQVRTNNTTAPLQTGDTLDVVLRPDVATDQSLALTVYRRQGDMLVPVEVDVRWSDEGAARVSAVLDESLGLEWGTQDWWFVVAHEDNAPSVRALRGLGDNVRGEGWQAFRVVFDLEP